MKGHKIRSDFMLCFWICAELSGAFWLMSEIGEGRVLEAYLASFTSFLLGDLRPPFAQLSTARALLLLIFFFSICMHEES